MFSLDVANYLNSNLKNFIYAQKNPPVFKALFSAQTAQLPAKSGKFLVWFFLLVHLYVLIHMCSGRDTFLCFVFYIKPFIILWVSDWGSQSFIKWLTNNWMILNRSINIKTNLFPFPYNFHLQGLPFFK